MSVGHRDNATIRAPRYAHERVEHAFASPAENPAALDDHTTSTPRSREACKRAYLPA
jgi:hypothetical protein